MPINILYLTVKGLRFTSSQQLGLYVRRFSSGRFRCHVAVHRALADSTLLASLGVGVHLVPGLRGWRKLTARLMRVTTMAALAQLVDDHRIDLIHSFQTSSAPYALELSSRTGVPHVVQVRNTYDSPGHYIRFKLNEAKTLLTLSETMMERYMDMAGSRARPDQLRFVIPNGIDVRAYLRTGDARDIRAELGLHPGQPVVGMVGMLSPRKDPLLALEVAARVTSSRPDARFVFVGGFSDEKYRRRFLSRIDELGLREACVQAGYQADVAPYLKAMDLLLHTARREGHAKVFNEAMAFARPVVSSRITGSVDVIEDGINGVLCDPDDAAAFASAVLGLIDSPERRSTLGQAGQAIVESRFSSEHTLAMLERLYEQVAAGRTEAARIQVSSPATTATG